MRRARAVVTLAVALGALTLAACGGDDQEATTSPAPAEAPSETAAPPSAGALPPELVECYADQGIDIESPTEIHSAPPEVVQKCFGALHQGGGAGVP